MKVVHGLSPAQFIASAQVHSPEKKRTYAVAVPDYETLMLPVLEYLSDGQVRKTAQLVSYIAERFKLSPDDLKQLIPSGRAKLLNNRVGWACTYLRKAGLISSPRRAYNQITDDGTRVLAGHPQKIDITFLQQFPKFRQFQEGNKATEKHEGKASAALTEQTPEEIIGAQSELINGSLAADLLEQIATMDPDAFEQSATTPRGGGVMKAPRGGHEAQPVPECDHCRPIHGPSHRHHSARNRCPASFGAE